MRYAKNKESMAQHRKQDNQKTHPWGSADVGQRL